ncbi:uncharacterized protein [Panulirus ornatus]|uniref:uncharacterized protein n=1 Tax=Panulirus ornatus TaxID=150431 RepID=UPI003A8BA344
MKSCFGEEVAVQLERFAYSVGQSCEELEETRQTSLLDDSSRRKRSLLKLPDSPSISLMMCNLRKMELVTTEDEVNYPMVEEQLQKAAIDDGLKFEIMEVLTFCRSLQEPVPDLLPGNPYNEVLKSVISIENYFNCVIPESIRTCRIHEMQLYFDDLI